MRNSKHSYIRIFLVSFAVIALYLFSVTAHAEERRTLDNLRLTITALPTVMASRMPTRMPSPNPTSIVATIRASACSAMIDGVKGRESSVVESVNRLVAKLSALTDSVNTYYTGTLVPAGKTIPNYADLLAAVNTKKAAVQAALASLKTSVTNFTCAGGDLRTQTTSFRADMQKLLSSVREYITAVRTYVSAVRPLIPVSPTVRALSPTRTSMSPTIEITRRTEREEISRMPTVSRFPTTVISHEVSPTPTH